MKHAGAQALDRIEPLLADLRRREGLKEKSRGVFYRAGKAFLHFHEHGEDEVFADLRRGTDFVRFAVTAPAQRKAFLAALDRELRDGKSARGR